MSIKHFCSALFMATVIVATVSCKKDEETESKPSLNGSLRFTGLAEYISAVKRDANGNALDSEGNIANTAKEKEFIAFPVQPTKSVSHPEGGTIGYYWKQNPAEFASLNSVNDTCYLSNNELDPEGRKTLHFKDSIYTCTVTCGAFADGYYDSSASYYTTIVDPRSIGGSLDNTGFETGDEKITDKRDGKEYFTVKIGDRTWFRQNLAYRWTDGTESSLAFRNCDVMSRIYGEYYTYRQITDTKNPVCPEGWHVATEQDWLDLGTALSGKVNANNEITDVADKIMADAKFNGKKMWTYWGQFKISNDSKLSIVPAGWANSEAKSFVSSSENINDTSNGKQYAAFLLAPAAGDNLDDASVYYRYIISNSTNIFKAKGDRNSFAASVRCVKD